MTAIELIHALAVAVEGALKNYEFEADNHPHKPFTVYEQHVPKAHLENRQGKYHPLVAVALDSIEDDEDAIAELGLTFAVYGEADDTWRDLLNAMETVRLELLARPTLEHKYRLIKPMETTLAEVQPAPFFYGLMTVRYQMYQPEEEINISVKRVGGKRKWQHIDTGST